MNKRIKSTRDKPQEKATRHRRTQKKVVGDAPTIDSWSALREYLQRAPEKIRRIEVPPHQASRLAELLSETNCQGLDYSISRDPEMKGLKVEIDLRAYDEIEFMQSVESEPPRVIIALDQISDPRNLGAIARTAAFFGIPWLLCPKDRQAPLNDGAMASAQGAFVYTKVASVVNLARTLRQLKERQYWVFGASLDGSDLLDAQSDHDRVVLVLGNEGRGLRPLVAKTCDVLFQIPGSAQRVESLNVAVAAGIAAHHFCKRGTL